MKPQTADERAAEIKASARKAYADQAAIHIMAALALQVVQEATAKCCTKEQIQEHLNLAAISVGALADALALERLP